MSARRYRKRPAGQKADQRSRRRLGVETLEDRRLLAVSFEFNYSEDNSIGFNDPIRAAQFRNALDTASERLGGWLLHDATIQMDVRSSAYTGDFGTSPFATGRSVAPPENINGAFDHGVIPSKILGLGDRNGASPDGLLEVFFFDNADPYSYEIFPDRVDQETELDFQAAVIRALVHAIGFESATNPNGSDDYGRGTTNPGTWRVLDRFLSDADGNELIDSDPNSPTAFQMDTSANQWPLDSVGGPGPDAGLFFSGPISTEVYGGPVPLYSPADGPSASLYLGNDQVSVTLGASMSAEPFANLSTAESLSNIIDSPNADAFEYHTQDTHVWVSGSDLELDFDFGQEHQISTFHFWNYVWEPYDTDEIDIVFTNTAGTVVGTLNVLNPELGAESEADPIFAEDFLVTLSGPARYANVMVRGSNQQIDFQNIGFSIAGELESKFDVPHLDSEGYPGISVFSPQTHLLSQAFASGPVPQELTLLEKAMMADLGVLFREEIAPVITAPSINTLEANSRGGHSGQTAALNQVLNSVTVTDRIDPNPVLTNDANFAFMPLGENDITFVATDASGNHATETFPVTVVDTTPPVINLPSTISVEISQGDGITQFHPALAGILNAGVSDVVDSPLDLELSPSILPLGTSSTVVTATDQSGNTSSTIVDITVEQESIELFDFGDAPQGYAVRLDQDGARHTLGSLRLGLTINEETDGQPDANAAGDEDDGVRAISTAVVDDSSPSIASLIVDVTGVGKLDAWIDFNDDQDWQDEGEQIVDSADVGNGENTISYLIPAGAMAGDRTMRVRLSSSGNLSPTGHSDDGEVEDYLWSIVSLQDQPDIRVDSVGDETIILSLPDQISVGTGVTDLLRVERSDAQSIEVAGTNSNDRFLISGSQGFSSPLETWNLSGGLGRNTLVIEAAASFDFKDQNVDIRQFANVDLLAEAATQIIVDSSSIRSLENKLRSVSFEIGEEDSIQVADASDWTMTEREILGEELWLVARSDSGEEIRLRSPRPWQNFLLTADVNNDGSVSALDALQIINEMSSNRYSDPETFNLVDPTEIVLWPHAYYDLTGDQRVTALDALRVINEIGDSEIGDSEGNAESEEVTPILIDQPQVVSSLPNRVPTKVIEQRNQILNQIRDLPVPNLDATVVVQSLDAPIPATVNETDQADFISSVDILMAGDLLLEDRFLEIRF